MKRRVWVRRTALVGGLVLIAIFGILQTDVPPSLVMRDWLDARRQGFSYAWRSWKQQRFFRLLYQVTPGSSLQEVKQIMGEGSLLAGEDRRRYMVFAAKGSEIEFPEGLDESDAFLTYNGPGIGVILQFRNNKLVNFNPQHYKNFESQTAVAIPIPQ